MKIGKKTIDNFDEFIIAEDITGYIDITSVKNFIEIGNLLFKDYEFIRSCLKQLAFEKWNELTLEDQTTICRYKATSENVCLSLLGDTYDFYMNRFGIEAKKSRERRFEAASTILRRTVDISSRYAILGALNSTPLENNYIKYGIKGTNDLDPMDGLFDFIESTGSFILSGIKNMNLIMINDCTKEKMIEEIMNALRNGNYE